MSDEVRVKQITEETEALYRALHAVLDEETADRLFPVAWRQLRRVRRDSRLPIRVDRGDVYHN
jgi:hypothetical protein